METLDQLERRHQLERRALAYALAKTGDQRAKRETRTGYMRTLTKFIARKHGVPVSDLVGPRRFSQYNEPRREIWARLKAKNYTLQQIGDYFNRDHTTILHGIQKWNRSLDRLG